MKTHWDARSQHWAQFRVPLQPNQEIIDYFLSEVSADQHILLLGVTRQIAEAYNNVTAVDYSPNMIQRVWVGNSKTKTAILQNWLDYTPTKKFDAVLGDASINMLQYPQEVKRFFNRLHLWIEPGRPLICRMFTRFSEPVTINRIYSELETNRNFNAWRRLLNMYLAEQNGSLVRHSDTLNLFNTLFQDRSQLPWDAETVSKMDTYKDTTTSTWFPTRQEILDIIPGYISAQFVDVGTYEHYTAYPILICKIQENK